MPHINLHHHYQVSKCGIKFILLADQLITPSRLTILKMNSGLFYLRKAAGYGIKKFEPRHDKTNILALPPAWIQTSLRICAV
jgi:hypothetical protein